MGVAAGLTTKQNIWIARYNTTTNVLSVCNGVYKSNLDGFQHAVGTQTPLDLVLAFRAHEGTSHHTAVSGHLVDAVVALGYIPWFESAVVVHCKVVVCDNLFGLEP